MRESTKAALLSSVEGVAGNSLKRLRLMSESVLNYIDSPLFYTEQILRFFVHFSILSKSY